MPQTNFSYMFADNKYITKEDVEEILSHWEINKATSLAGMFKDCVSITSLDLNWELERAVPIHEMFSGCENLESINGLEDFSVEGLTNLNSLFRNCHKLKELDLSNWDVSSVTNMDYMFTNCYELTSFGGFDWETENLESAIAIFANCKKLVINNDNEDNKFNWKLGSLKYIFNEDSKNPLSMFTGCESLIEFKPTEAFEDFEMWYVKNFAYMFANCTNLKKLDFSILSPGNVASMSHMFENCTNLILVDLYYSPNGVTDTSYMFYNCINLDALNYQRRLNTSNITDMSYMFYNCKLLWTQGDETWDLSRVENMSHMFENSGAGRIYLGNQKTTSLKDITNIFNGCSELVSLDLSAIDTRNIKSINNMLKNCTALKGIAWGSDFKVNNLTELVGVFQNCSSLVKLDLRSWNTANIKNMSSLFSGCTSLVTLNIQNFNIATDCNTGSMFTSTSALKLINCRNQQCINALAGLLVTSQGGSIITNTTSGITSDSVTILSNKNWSITTTPKTLTRYKVNTDLVGVDSRIYTYLYLEEYAEYVIVDESTENNIITRSIQYINLPSDMRYYDLEFKGANITEVLSCDISPFTRVSFEGCKNLVTINGISSWDTSNLTDMNDMFRDCEKLASLDVSSWNTSEVTNMGYMFSGCKSLTSIDVSKWKTDQVTNMSYMLNECNKLASLNLSNWNTSRVTNMQYMFYNCDSLTTIGNTSNWNTSNVTNMQYMFYDCHNLGAIEGISSWNVNRVEQMNSMFYECSSLKTLDLSTWNPHLKGMSYMFYDCSSLESLDLRNFVVTDVSNMNYAFYNCGSLKTLNLTNWSAPNVTTVRYMFDGCTSLSTLNTNGFIIKNVSDMYYVFNRCSSLRTLDLSGWDISNVYNGNWYNLNFYLENFDSFTNIRTSISMPSTLTHDSLVDVIANLATVLGETLTLGATNLAKLTPAEIAVATNKGWTVV